MLLNEQELTKDWGEWSPDEPVVSVICCTYNQEMYIEDALKGFFSQKTNFPFEVIVQNDASTDSTKQIIDRWHKQYLNVLKPFHHEENQFSQGHKPGPIAIGRSKGEYIAMCEGDDYWIDDNKLQKQHDALQRHPNVDLCFHPARIDNLNGSKRNNYGEKTKIISAEAVITGRGAFIPTASILVRGRALLPLPKWFSASAPVGDTFIQALGALRGGVIYVPEAMSVYREMTSGSISLSNKQAVRPASKIQERVSGYKKAYEGLKKRTAQEGLHKAIDDACEESLFECLVDAVRLGDYRLCSNLSKNIDVTRLRFTYRSCVVLLARFRLTIPVLAWLVEVKRKLQ